MIYAKFTGTI